MYTIHDYLADIEDWEVWEPPLDVSVPFGYDPDDEWDLEGELLDAEEAFLRGDYDVDYHIKGEARDRKIAKRKHGMRVDGRSVFTIQQAQQKRDERRSR